MRILSTRCVLHDTKIRLCAVLFYFRRDFYEKIQGVRALRGRDHGCAGDGAELCQADGTAAGRKCLHRHAAAVHLFLPLGLEAQLPCRVCLRSAPADRGALCGSSAPAALRLPARVRRDGALLPCVPDSGKAQLFPPARRGRAGLFRAPRDGGNLRRGVLRGIRGRPERVYILRYVQPRLSRTGDADCAGDQPDPRYEPAGEDNREESLIS